MRPEQPPVYRYESSLKSRVSDEAINTYVIRPAAGLLVRWLYPTPVTPNQLTLLSTAVGLAAAPLLVSPAHSLTAMAGLLITLKDVLDSADGQLARARREYSRSGRFLDSLGDFLVNAALFIALGIRVAPTTGVLAAALLAAAGFLGTTLRVSYHVYYQTAYLQALGVGGVNRLSEEIQPADAQEGEAVLKLQKAFLLLYGWQDRLVAALDRASGRAALTSDVSRHRWATDAAALRLASTIGLGTDLFLLMLCAVANAPGLYLGINLIVLNALWCGAVAYRRGMVLPRVRGGTSGEGAERKPAGEAQ
jgi:phosphatidylglycerophosphate synthase